MPVKPEEFLEMYPEYLLTEEEKARWLETRPAPSRGVSPPIVSAGRSGIAFPYRRPPGPTAVQRTWEFDLVGIYEGAEKEPTRLISLSVRFFRRGPRFRKRTSRLVLLRVEDADKAVDVAKAIDEQFANSPYETKAETEGAFLKAFADQVGDIGTIIMAILAAVFFTIFWWREYDGVLGAGAHRRACGPQGGRLTDRQVLGLVLAEALWFAAVGGFLGLGIGWYLVSLGDPTNGSLPVFYFPPRDIVLGVVLVFALGLAAGILPAIEAGRLRIADALRRL